MREGAAPIDLVDIGGKIGLLTEYRLGVVTQTVHVVDRSFFSDYLPPPKDQEGKSLALHSLHSRAVPLPFSAPTRVKPMSNRSSTGFYSVELAQ
jgi:hypothetical protein